MEAEEKITLNERRLVGGILILLGALAVLEARRLAALRELMVAGAAVGDDTLPLIIGVALLLLGLHAVFVARWPMQRVEFPARVERRKLFATAGALLGYFLVTPYLGYTVSTLVIATSLYRAIGGYRWPLAVLIGAATTGALFLIFKIWLLEPLPTGWIGF